MQGTQGATEAPNRAVPPLYRDGVAHSTDGEKDRPQEAKWEKNHSMQFYGLPNTRRDRQVLWKQAHAEIPAGDKQPDQGGGLPNLEGQHYVCGHPYHCQPGVL